MPVSSTMAAVAVMNSNIAMEHARAAEIRSCGDYMQQFHAEGATIQQMKAYAECINMLYPSEMTHDDIVLIKITLLISFLGLMIGAWNGWKEDGWAGACFYGFMSFFVAPMIAGAVGGIFWCFLWLVGVV